MTNSSDDEANGGKRDERRERRRQRVHDRLANLIEENKMLTLLTQEDAEEVQSLRHQLDACEGEKRRLVALNDQQDTVIRQLQDQILHLEHCKFVADVQSKTIEQQDRSIQELIEENKLQSAQGQMDAETIRALHKQNSEVTLERDRLATRVGKAIQRRDECEAEVKMLLEHADELRSSNARIAAKMTELEERVQAFEEEDYADFFTRVSRRDIANGQLQGSDAQLLLIKRKGTPPTEVELRQAALDAGVTVEAMAEAERRMPHAERVVDALAASAQKHSVMQLSPDQLRLLAESGAKASPKRFSNYALQSQFGISPDQKSASKTKTEETVKDARNSKEHADMTQKRTDLPLPKSVHHHLTAALNGAQAKSPQQQQQQLDNETTTHRQDRRTTNNTSNNDGLRHLGDRIPQVEQQRRRADSTVSEEPAHARQSVNHSNNGDPVGGGGSESRAIPPDGRSHDRGEHTQPRLVQPHYTHLIVSPQVAALGPVAVPHENQPTHVTRVPPQVAGKAHMPQHHRRPLASLPVRDALSGSIVADGEDTAVGVDDDENDGVLEGGPLSPTRGSDSDDDDDDDENSDSPSKLQNRSTLLKERLAEVQRMGRRDDGRRRSDGLPSPTGGEVVSSRQQGNGNSRVAVDDPAGVPTNVKSGGGHAQSKAQVTTFKTVRERRQAPSVESSPPDESGADERPALRREPKQTAVNGSGSGPGMQTSTGIPAIALQRPTAVRQASPSNGAVRAGGVGGAASLHDPGGATSHGSVVAIGPKKFLPPLVPPAPTQAQAPSSLYNRPSTCPLVVEAVYGERGGASDASPKMYLVKYVSVASEQWTSAENIDPNCEALQQWRRAKAKARYRKPLPPATES